MDHHAVLVLGESEEFDAHIESLGVKILGNPDVFVFNEDSFAVDDARALSERALEKSFGEKKFFIIKSGKYTEQAQNALLKTLEDPVPNTHFIISAREAGMFLPTLLSRMQVVNAGGELGESNDAKKFLKKTLKQRIDFAKKFADEVKEGLPAGRRGAGALAEFLDSLLLILRSEEAPLATQKKVMTLRTYARDSAAMPRLIIEHLALVL